MNTNARNFRKATEFFGALCGGLLISLPAIPQALAQQSTPKINPCPSIFYEEPHNSRVVVPQGCPPNALTQTLAAQGLLPVSATPSSEQTKLGVGGETSPGNISAPEPGARQPSPIPPIEGQLPPMSPEPGARPQVQPPQPSSATIAITNARVNVRLVNDTATNVTYQVIGDTTPRSLQGKSNVTLQALTVPLTVTFQREDGGQLTVTPQASSETGTLEVKFNEATDATQGRSAMRIEQNGSVFFN